MTRLLIIGANGLLGTELTRALAERHGAECVVTADMVPKGKHPAIRHEMMDATDFGQLQVVVQKHGVTQIYMLAAAKPDVAEHAPQWSWNLNIASLMNVLEVARQQKLDKIFWPSSASALGPATVRLPSCMVTQCLAREPVTVDGMSKLAGEWWCRWYAEKYAVDVRSMRLPDLRSQGTAEGRSPAIDHAVRAAIELMEAPRAASMGAAAMAFEA